MLRILVVLSLACLALSAPEQNLTPDKQELSAEQDDFLRSLGVDDSEHADDLGGFEEVGTAVEEVGTDQQPDIHFATGLEHNPALLEALRQYNDDPSTIPEENSDPEHAARMDELREVFDEFYQNQVTDDSVVLKGILERINDDLDSLGKENAELTAELKEKLVNDLDLMQDIIYQVDKAVDFCKMGGIETHLRLYNSADPEIRGYAAWNLGIVASNNPAAQDYLHSRGVIEATIEGIHTAKSEDRMFMLRGIYALSALSRQNSTGIAHFVQADGPRTLLDAVKRFDSPPVAHKFLRLVADTIELSPEDAPYSGSGICVFVQDTLVGMEVSEDMNFNVVRDVVNYLSHTGRMCPIRIDTVVALEKLVPFRAEFDRDLFADLTNVLRRGPRDEL